MSTGQVSRPVVMVTHESGCHFLVLREVWDGMVGNQRRDCDCGAYQRAVDATRAAATQATGCADAPRSADARDREAVRPSDPNIRGQEEK